MVTNGIEDQIILFPRLGIVLFRIVNDVICTERTQEVRFVTVINASYLGAVKFGELDGKTAHRATSAIDQNSLAAV